jgi:glycosyltransferase involved in cell wall biosynthesis
MGTRGQAPGAAPSPPSEARPRGRAATRLYRLLRTLDFYRRAVGVVRRERPALLHCNDYNTLWVGAAARVVSPGTAVVYDSHELWPDRNLRPEPRWWLLACEAALVRTAHAVLATSPGHADVMARRYRIPRPLVVLNVPARTHAIEAGPAREPDVAVYVGGLQPHRGLEPAIDALALVSELRLRLVGPGRREYVGELLARARALGVGDRVEVREPVEPDAVLDAIRGAAFGLALFQPVCLSHRLVAPNKLFEYSAAALPTLASDLPVMRAFVEEWGLGLTVVADDVRQVAEAARTLLDPETNLIMRRAAAAAAAGRRRRSPAIRTQEKERHAPRHCQRFRAARNDAGAGRHRARLRA